MMLLSSLVLSLAIAVFGQADVSSSGVATASPAPAASPAPEATPTAEKESFEAVAEKIAAAWNRHSTLRAKIHSLAETPGARRTVEIKGSVLVKRVEGPDLQLTDTTTVTTLGEGEHAAATILNQLEQFDGKQAFITRNIGAETRAFKVKDEFLQRVAGAELCDQLRRLQEPEVDTAVQLNDQDVYVIESRPKGQMAPLDRVVSYVSKADGVLIKVELLAADGAVLRSLNLFDLQFDEELPADSFEFKPSPEVKIIDQAGGKTVVSPSPSPDPAAPGTPAPAPAQPNPPQ